MKKYITLPILSLLFALLMAIAPQVQAAATGYYLPFTSRDGTITITRTGAKYTNIYANMGITSFDKHPNEANVSGQRAAIDIGVGHGRDVLAAKAGTVAGYGQGCYVYLKHGDGKYSEYRHINPINVRVGQSVKQGQVLGEVDQNACGSQGAHLHFAVWNGVPWTGANELIVKFSDQNVVSKTDGYVVPGKSYSPENIRRTKSSDFNGDGRDDLTYFGMCGSNSDPCWRTHLSNGSSFVWKNFGASMGFDGNLSHSPLSKVKAGDFNGDGFFDIVYRGICGSNSEPCWRAHLGSKNEFTWTNMGDAGEFDDSLTFNQPLVGDFNGNGRQDLAFVGKCGGQSCWWVGLSQKVSGKWKFVSQNYNNPSTSNPDLDYDTSQPNNALVSGDFDGNGLDDVAYVGACSGQKCWRVHLNQNKSFKSKQNFGNDFHFSSDTNRKHQLFAGDFNGDGIDDVGYFGECVSDPNKKCLVIHHSTGSSFTTGKDYASDTWFNDSHTHSLPIVGDFDGNKKDDVTYFGKCGKEGNSCWRTHLSKNGQFEWENFGSSSGFFGWGYKYDPANATGWIE